MNINHIANHRDKTVARTNEIFRVQGSRVTVVYFGYVHNDPSTGSLICQWTSSIPNPLTTDLGRLVGLPDCTAS